jgi:hypothetical protein
MKTIRNNTSWSFQPVVCTLPRPPDDVDEYLVIRVGVPLHVIQTSQKGCGDDGELMRIFGALIAVLG